MSARAWQRRRRFKRLQLELRRALKVVRDDPTKVYHLPAPFSDLVVVSFEYYQRLKRAEKIAMDLAENESGRLFTAVDAI